MLCNIGHIRIMHGLWIAYLQPVNTANASIGFCLQIFFFYSFLTYFGRVGGGLRGELFPKCHKAKSI